MTQERLESIRKELDISLIKLNPENPRLGAVLGMNYNGENSLTQEQISSSLQMMSQGDLILI